MLKPPAERLHPMVANWRWRPRAVRRQVRLGARNRTLALTDKDRGSGAGSRDPPRAVPGRCSTPTASAKAKLVVAFHLASSGCDDLRQFDLELIPKEILHGLGVLGNGVQLHDGKQLAATYREQHTFKTHLAASLPLLLR